jgi:hypothetical protein
MYTKLASIEINDNILSKVCGAGARHGGHLVHSEVSMLLCYVLCITLLYTLLFVVFMVY